MKQRSVGGGLPSSFYLGHTPPGHEVSRLHRNAGSSQLSSSQAPFAGVSRRELEAVTTNAYALEHHTGAFDENVNHGAGTDKHTGKDSQRPPASCSHAIRMDR